MASFKNSYRNLKSAAKIGIAGGLALLASGCITFTGENGLWTIATSPARPSQWKNHSVRTGTVTGCYIGGIYYATRDRSHKSHGVQEQFQIDYSKYRESNKNEPNPLPTDWGYGEGRTGGN